MKLASIHIYPVKGCRGIALETAELDALGLVGDRRFMVVDAAGKFHTQRTHPRMALVATALTLDTLTLCAPGVGTIEIPRHENAQQRRVTVEIWKSQNFLADDCGDEAAAWLSQHLATPSRLVRIGSAFHRPLNPAKPSTRPGDVVSFADSHPLLVISEATLAELNVRLTARSEPSVPMERFRPNLVVTDCPPHAEDTAPRLRVGNEIVIRAAGPCARCIVTTIDQQTAARDAHEPLRTLATYRRDPAKPTDVNFGQNFINETKTGTLRIGDSIAIIQ